MNNNGTFVNQQLNLTQQISTPMVNQPQHQLAHMLNQQPRFSSAPQQQQQRMVNPQQGILNTQSGVINTQQGVINPAIRLREPQRFTQCMCCFSFIFQLFFMFNLCSTS